jgi:hypothetical protein
MNCNHQAQVCPLVRKLLTVAALFGRKIEPNQRFYGKVEEFFQPVLRHSQANMCQKADSAHCAMGSTRIVSCLHVPPFLNASMK